MPAFPKSSRPGLIARLLRREPTARQPVLPPKPSDVPAHAAEPHRAILRAARDLPDGTPCDEELIAALSAEIYARRAATATLDGPEPPRTTGLCVRRTGLPDWWEQNGNLLLCAPDARVTVDLSLMRAPAYGAIAVIGARINAPTLHFVGDDTLVIIGDGAQFNTSAITISDGATILIGEAVTVTWMAMVDARNAGIIIVGADNMWAAGVRLMTDDTHAIRDAATGVRLNIRGGRIIIERHVWLCDHAHLMGDCVIGRDGIVGSAGFVKNTRLPANSVSVGRPARPTRHGVTWTRNDGP